MSGRMFTPHQRHILHRRLSRALLWRKATAYERDVVNDMATVVLDELELSGFSAAAQRRAVEKVVASIDEAAPLRSVSPVERDAQPVADATELDSGAAS